MHGLGCILEYVYKITTYIELSSDHKISIHRVTKFKAGIAPQCSHIKERRMDKNIEKLEPETPE